MIDFLGYKCPYCNEKFREGDDVAVCPDCGTPHHRECYAGHNACANADRHAAGFDWAKESRKETAGPEGQGTFACPSCGRQVLSGSSFCNYCGTPFNGQIGAYRPPNQEGGTSLPPAPPFSGSSGDYYDSVMDGVRKTKEFDEISVNDWLVYIGNSAGYYLGYFKIQDESGRKTSFTFSAMVMPVIYFIYRRMWGIAIAALACNALFFAPTALLSLHQNSLLVLADPAFWTAASNIAFFASLLVNLVWGLYAVYLYRKVSGKRIRSIKDKSATPQEYQQRLSRTSGPSTAAVSIILGVVMALMLSASLLGILQF